MGTPSSRIAPVHEWKSFTKISLPKFKYNTLRDEFPDLSESGIDLLSRLLTYDPSKRITAEKALAHPYFTESPLPKQPSMMPTFPVQTQIVESSTQDRSTTKRRIGYRDERFGEAFDTTKKKIAKTQQ